MEGAVRVTRAREKKRRVDEGIPDEPPKPKRQTLGQYLAEEREKITNELQEKDKVNNYEMYSLYNKEDVIKTFNAENIPCLAGQSYKSADEGPQLVFLTLETGPHPKTFTHLCNNSSLIWNIASLKISHSQQLFGVPNVVMLFVRGKHISGTEKEKEGMYKYIGLVGVQSTSSGSSNGIGTPYIHLEVRFVFDYVLTKAELAEFGEHVMKCKKNRYGCSLCN